MMDWETLRSQVAWFRDAGGAGPVVLRVNPETVDAAEPHAPFTGSIPSVVDDMARACAAGVDVVVWDLNMADVDDHRQVAILEAVASSLDARGVTMT